MKRKPAAKLAPSLLPLALAGVIGAALPEARAFRLRTSPEGAIVAWRQRELHVAIDTRSAPNVPGVVDAVRGGFEVWTSSGLPVQLTFEEDRDGAPVGTGPQIVVRWEPHSWKHGQAVAVTHSLYERGSGRVTQTEILLDAVARSWATTASGGERAFDIQSVIAHEAGHLFGLDHSDDPEATMYAATPAGEVKKRTLEADDLAGVAALVQTLQFEPAAPLGAAASASVSRLDDQPAPLPRDAVGCAVAPGGVGPPWPALLLLALTRRRRRR